MRRTLTPRRRRRAAGAHYVARLPMARTESEPRLPPSPLVFLLLATFLVGCAWALLVPPFQAPDENAHVAYVQSLAERGALPGNEGEGQSTEQRAAADAANA